MRHYSSFRKDETMQALLYILSKIELCNIHKAFKILYFADQMHLAQYGRSITGDTYIAMEYGPVPSSLYDIVKAVRGDSYFAAQAEEFRPLIAFHNKYTMKALLPPNLDYLSPTDIECLDRYIAQLDPLSFEEITILSHGEAWQNTAQNRNISFKDMMREAGESEDYADFIDTKLRMEAVTC